MLEMGMLDPWLDHRSIRSSTWHFYLQHLLWHTEHKMTTKQKHIDHGNSGHDNQYDVTTDQLQKDKSGLEKRGSINVKQI